MATRRKSRRWLASLIAAIIFFAVAIAVLFLVPSSPINRSHASQDVTPVQVTLPPTAPLVTPTTHSSKTKTATSGAGATPTATASH